MKGKRILLGLLALLCLLAPQALAEKAVLRLWDIEADSAFWRANPEIGFRRVGDLFYGDSLQTLQSAQPDVALARLYNDDWASVTAAGLAADLSQSPVLSEAVAGMVPWVRQLVTTEEGQILALPLSAAPKPFTWYEDAWAEAGLARADVPQSYTELLDFLDAWAARVRQNPEKKVCVSRLLRWSTGKERYDYTYWLMELLLQCHETQQRYAGEPIRFDTPDFIALAQRTRETGLALYEAEPRRSKRQKMLQLFQSDLNGGEQANNGLPYGMSHALPLRLWRTQPALHKLSVELGWIRAGSPLYDEGVRLLEYRHQTRPWTAAYALMTDFAAGDYTFENGRLHHVDANWLAEYRSFEGVFVAYPLSFNQPRDGQTDKEALLTRFFSGKLSAQELAQKLDALLP